MGSRGMLTMGILGAAMAWCQQPTPAGLSTGPGVQAPSDAKYPDQDVQDAASGKRRRARQRQGRAPAGVGGRRSERQHRRDGHSGRYCGGAAMEGSLAG